MDNVETYNRVPSLEPPLLKTGLTSLYSMLLLLIISGALANLLFHDLWPYSLHLALLALALYLSIYIYDSRRQYHCRFCKKPLNTITRPFLLTSKYLTVRGIKVGNYFYTRCRWGNNVIKPRAVKISNLSKACHHCRLTEEKYSQLLESPSQQELEKLKGEF